MNSAERIPRLPTMTEILARVGEIAAMPQVVYKILELTGTTVTPAQEIEDAISIDPGFSSKVLILANSAFYALPRRVTSIREAATFMGYKTIRQLAMTVGAFDIFVGKTDSGSMRRRMWWRHSVDTAVCAKAIATEIPRVIAEDAYSCGLLHDVGKSLLDRYETGMYLGVEHGIENGLSALDSERSVYGCTHADIGGAAAKSWNLPPMIAEAVAHHHGPAAGSFAMHIALTSLASDFAHAIVTGRKIDEHKVEQPIRELIADWAVEALRFSDEQLDRAYRACKDSISNRTGMGT